VTPANDCIVHYSFVLLCDYDKQTANTALRQSRLLPVSRMKMIQLTACTDVLNIH